MGTRIRSGSMKGLTATIAAMAMCGGIVSTASAGSIIFKDNFNRGHYGYSSKVGNGWKELENNYNDAAIKHNHLLLRDARWGTGPDAAVTHTIDTRGYMNVYMMYDYKPTTYTKRFWGRTKIYNYNESNDYLNVDFRVLGTDTWTNIASHSLGNANKYGWTWNTASLGPYADDTMLQLRFWTDVSEPWYHRTYFGGHYHFPGKNEGAYIDALKIWGDPKPTAATPEPSTMALFATGMVGMGLWRMRRNKKEEQSS